MVLYYFHALPLSSFSLSSGVNTVLGPLYISEISPIKYRGAMGTFFQLSVTSTILLSQLFGINAVS